MCTKFFICDAKKHWLFDFTKKYLSNIHFTSIVYYNFVKIHSSLSVTPAMQAGLMKKPMTIEDIANLVLVEVPKKRGTYIKREKNSV